MATGLGRFTLLSIFHFPLFIFHFRFPLFFFYRAGCGGEKANEKAHETGVVGVGEERADSGAASVSGSHRFPLPAHLSVEDDGDPVVHSGTSSTTELRDGLAIGVHLQRDGDLTSSAPSI